MRNIFVNSSDAVGAAVSFVNMAQATGLSNGNAKDKSFKASVTRDNAGKIIKATATTTGWLTETEVEFD